MRAHPCMYTIHHRLHIRELVQQLLVYETPHLVRITLGRIRGSSDQVKTDQFSHTTIRISCMHEANNLLKQYSVHMYGLHLYVL